MDWKIKFIMKIIILVKLNLLQIDCNFKIIKKIIQWISVSRNHA